MCSLNIIINAISRTQILTELMTSHLYGLDLPSNYCLDHIYHLNSFGTCKAVCLDSLLIFTKEEIDH